MGHFSNFPRSPAVEHRNHNLDRTQNSATRTAICLAHMHSHHGLTAPFEPSIDRIIKADG